MPSNAAKQREWREKQRSKGLCSNCTEPAMKGYTRCFKHHEEHRGCTAATKKKRKEKGVCKDCGRPLDNSELLTCIVCRQPHHFNPFRGG